MKPYKERTPDTQYQDLLRFVLDNGEVAKTQQETDAITYIAPPPLRFKFDNGFPVTTERNLAPQTMPIPIWQKAIGEICAFMNGARTLEQLTKFGCEWWKDWLTPTKCAKRGLEAGDAGPGSYGAAFHDFPTADGGTFNQIKHLVEQIRELDHLRTHFVSPWIPQYIGRGRGKQQKVVVAPCHGWMHVRIINGKLTLHMYQRAADLVLGLPSNIVQYAALTLMLAHITGFPAYEYVHSISDAHIYVDHISAVETMVSREPRAFPTITFDTGIESIFDFRSEHFHLSDYHPHPGIKGLRVAI